MLRILLLIVALLAIWSTVACTATCCEDEEAAAIQIAAGESAQVTGAIAAGAAADVDDEDDGDEADDDDGEEEEDEVQIPLSAVPASVLEAARAAVPGVVFSSAEVEKEHGQLVYCMEGLLGSERVEVEVSATGQVLEIERG